jgi:cytochrome c peroxidase
MRPIVLQLLAFAFGLVACEEGKKAPAPVSSVAAPSMSSSAPKARAPFDRAKLAAFAPLAASFDSKTNPSTEPRVALGKMLFFDARLSKGHDVSCNSCHDLATGGVDRKPVSTGHKGQKGGRNSPTVLNAAGHFAQFWDGRATDVEAQAKGPVLNPVEMAMPNEARVIDTLRSIPEYVKAFDAAFVGDKDPVTFENMARAIGAYERKLVTPSRWDKFLGGDDAALTDDEKEGLTTFVDTGCAACHQGSLVGAGMYQKAGLVVPWPNTSDPGRFAVTKLESDRMMFKVPSLRNVARTSPYFHDGATASLDDAVRIMARHQLGKTLKDDEVRVLVTWLKALSGEQPKELADAPKLPASTPKTPKPDKT